MPAIVNIAPGSLEISAVEVDFELYATGVKNLIDNALKYSSDKVLVSIDKNKICIIKRKMLPLPHQPLIVKLL